MLFNIIYTVINLITEFLTRLKMRDKLPLQIDGFTGFRIAANPWCAIMK